MSKVNFVSEFNAIIRYARDNCLPLRERMLWIALFYVANDRAAYNEQTQEYDWPDSYIQVSNGELGLYCCLDKRGIETLRNTLKQRGILDFRPGLKNKRNPAYKLNYLTVGCKIASNDVPNNVPATYLTLSLSMYPGIQNKRACWVLNCCQQCPLILKINIQIKLRMM